MRARIIRSEGSKGTNKPIRMYACGFIISWLWKREPTCRPDLTLTICLDSRSTAAMWMRFPTAAAGHKLPMAVTFHLLAHVARLC